MSFCISPYALLSALAGRAAHEGYEPTREELAAILKLGCTREEILAAFDRTGGGAMTPRVRVTLDSLLAPPTSP